jgi:solute carrier family 24 (sodium/potassium/calcium exchanger), member 6
LIGFGCFFLLWAVLAYFFTYRNRLPDCEISLCLVAFVMSIFWIWFISEILVDILKLIGVLINVPESFLAMTLLAFGNSAPGKKDFKIFLLDLSVNIALAKAGYGEMGIAGSIAGPLFNVLIGLGISLIKKNILE